MNGCRRSPAFNAPTEVGDRLSIRSALYTINRVRQPPIPRRFTAMRDAFIAKVRSENLAAASFNFVRGSLKPAGRGFNVSGRAFKSPGGAFKLPGRGFNVLDRSLKRPDRGFKSADRSFNGPGGAFKAPRCGFNIPGRSFKLSRRALELSAAPLNGPRSAFKFSSGAFNSSGGAFKLSGVVILLHRPSRRTPSITQPAHEAVVSTLAHVVRTLTGSRRRMNRIRVVSLGGQ